MDSSEIQIIEEHLKFIFEENRLSTFKKWVFPNNSKCNAAKMAEAGFIFVGSKEEPDSVKCFLCDKSLDGWSEDDDPWQEHLSHSSKCSFAQLQTTEQSLTLKEFVTIKNELMKVLIRRIYDMRKDRVIERTQSVEKVLRALKRKC